MSKAKDESSARLKIAAGVATFLVAWSTQATMGDSHMFSMSYTYRGFWPELLVWATFVPGWLLTLSLVGSGIGQLLDAPAGGSEPKPWELADSPNHYATPAAQRAPAGDQPPEPTSLMLEKNQHLAQALELGLVHYRVLWLVWSKGGVNRNRLAPRLNHTREEISGALRELETASLIEIGPAGCVTSSVRR